MTCATTSSFLGFQDLIVAALGCVFFSASSPKTAGLKFHVDNPKGGNGSESGGQNPEKVKCSYTG